MHIYIYTEREGCMYAHMYTYIYIRICMGNAVVTFLVYMWAMLWSYSTPLAGIDALRVYKASTPGAATTANLVLVPDSWFQIPVPLLQIHSPRPPNVPLLRGLVVSIRWYLGSLKG